MFPTVSYLIQYFTGVFIPLPVSTLGLFMVLAFFASYRAFKEEFKRKEKLGIIHPFTRKTVTGKPAPAGLLLLYGTVGFMIGFKLVYCLSNYRLFTRIPQYFLFSHHGNITGGILTGLLIAYGTYLQKKQHQSAKPVTIEATVHPYQLMDKLLLWCGVTGFAGAIILGKLENLSELFTDPTHYFSSFNGLVYYGGLIFGAITYLYMTHRAGIALSHAADIGSPGMMLAYGIGRIGCHLSGDGDWGIINTASQPHWLSWMPQWMWAFKFPHNVIRQGKYIPGCTTSYCNELVYPVFPTSFYEALICLLLFLLLWSVRHKIKIPGLMFSLFATLCGMERFFIEKIRINPQYHYMGWSFTQAQFISFIICFIGISGIFLSVIANKQKLKSPE